MQPDNDAGTRGLPGVQQREGRLKVVQVALEALST